MTNATKSLLIIFVSLTLLTALVKWTSGPASSEAFRSTLVDVETEQVNKIRIEKPAGNPSVILEESSGGWMVSNEGEEQYDADKSMVQRALNSLADLKVQSVVTRNPEKFTRYKVDSTGTIVSLFKDDKLLEAIVVGAPQFASQREFNNYVRPAGEETVYSVGGLLESTFSRELNQWRNKQIWNLDRENIVGIDFLLPADSSYSVERVGDQWISREDTLSRSGVNSILNRLSSLSASGFADSLTVADFGTERYAIRLKLEGGTEPMIRLKPDEQNASYFVATATDFPYVFTLYRSSWKNSVLKPREELLE